MIPDAERDIPWATEAFGKSPDAVNFWMGGKHSVTSMHKDPYENMYGVVRGSKRFILHPPTDLPCVPYIHCTVARYSKTATSEFKIKDEIITSHCNECNVTDFHSGECSLDGGVLNGTCECHRPAKVPWVVVDPLMPDYDTYPCYRFANGFVVTLLPGELLYLPSLWFHHVQQTDDTIAVNFWYDMDYDIKYNYYKFVESLIDIENNV